MSEASHFPIARRVGQFSEFMPFWPWQPWEKFLSRASVLRLCLSLCCVLSGLTLTACGALSPAPLGQREPTELELFIQASDRLNPDPQGRAAPILLRIYELRSADAFHEADFFALYLRDRATLGGEILMVDQFILRPGQAQTLQRRSNPETRYIGVVAGYRDLPISTWRVLYRLPAAPERAWYSGLTPGQTSSLRVDLLSNTVLITDLARPASGVTNVHPPEAVGPGVPGLHAEGGLDGTSSLPSPPESLDAMPGTELPADLKLPMPETPGPFHQLPAVPAHQGPLANEVPAKPAIAQ